MHRLSVLTNVGQAWQEPGFARQRGYGGGADGVPRVADGPAWLNG